MILIKHQWQKHKKHKQVQEPFCTCGKRSPISWQCGYFTGCKCSMKSKSSRVSAACKKVRPSNVSTHRSCWASPSFCRHWCLSASQWSSSQRNSPGNSDGGRGEWMRQCTTSRFSCSNPSKTAAKVYLQTFLKTLFFSSWQRRLGKNKKRETWGRRRLFIPAAMARFGRVFGQSWQCSWTSWANRTSTSSGLQTGARSRWTGRGQTDRGEREAAWNGWAKIL